MTDHSDTPITRPRWQRRLLIMSPALVLLAAILVFNWLVFSSPLPVNGGSPSPAATGVATAVPSQPAVAADNTPASQPTATAVAQAIVMDPTATPLPTVPPDAAITLLGPPPDSRLPAGSEVVLYWTWPLPLDDTRHFVVYLSQNGAETAVGVVPEANLGQSYRLTLPPGSLNAGEPATWTVQLQDIETGVVLLSSASRSVILLPE